MARNTKSATLPSNLRHHTAPSTEENETFFTKLKKRFRFKKGKYSVDINTGECDNVNPVSFKKRNSSELLDVDQPLKHGVGRSSERSARSESPQSNKSTARSQSDRFVVVVSNKPTHEGMNSNPTNHDLRYPLLTSNDYFKSGKTKAVIKTSKSDSMYKGNEYSLMKFEKDDSVIQRPIQLNTEEYGENECVMQDDSAIDLDTFDTDHVSHGCKVDEVLSYGIDPGYEHLPCRQKENSNLSESEKACGMSNVEQSTPTSNKSESSFEFDPHYESVNEAKNKIKEHIPHHYPRDGEKGYRALNESASKSIESLDDPCYQSIREVKKKPGDSITGSRKPFKTYDVSKSIESLDEPGYESLNDVKKRISENFQNNPLSNTVEQKNQMTASCDSKDAGNLDDSAVSFSMVNESAMGSRSQGLSDDDRNEHGGLTESSVSRDSGFDSKVDKSPDHTDCLYSTVKKKSVEEESVKVNVETLTKVAEVPSRTVLAIASVQESKESPVGAAQPLVPVEQRAELTEYDSETELILDPGYAECADAIKGFPPYQAFSDGSESKISSCTSLDLSAEDFPSEPGYAECADAIKSGAIKKISISREKLIMEDVTAADDVKFKKDYYSEIYANPQILFKKRSKLIERASGELSPSGTLSDNEVVGSIESLDSNSALTVTGTFETGDLGKAGDKSSPEAPPLPARNYSLYLESDDAAEFVPEDVDKLSGSDDAFEMDTHITRSAIMTVTETVETLSNNLKEQDIIRTMSESFEVHTDTQLEEELGISPENETYDISSVLTGNKFDQSADDSRVESFAEESVNSDVNCDQEERLNSHVKLHEDENVTSDTNSDVKGLHSVPYSADVHEKPTNNSSDDECVHVTVLDKHGNTKVLTVTDKQASQLCDHKRRKSDVQAKHIELEKSELEPGNDAKDGSNFIKKTFTGKHDVAYQDGVTETIATSESAANNLLPFNTNLNTDTFNTNLISEKSNTNASQIVTGNCENHIDTTNALQSADFNDELYRHKETPSEFLPVKKSSNLEVVHPVKMYSISWDSDEEFQGMDLLPKLEIIESDLENVFDSSDSSGKLVNTSTEQKRTVTSANVDFNCSGTFVNVSAEDQNRVTSGNTNHGHEGHGDKTVESVHCETVVHFDEIDSGNIELDLLDELKADKTSTIAEPVTSDHLENVFDDLQPCSERDSEKFRMCNTTGEQNHNNDECFCQLPLKNELKPELLYLYNDSEPTHMSLTEIMSLSSTSDSVLMAQSHSTKNTVNNITDGNSENSAQTATLIPHGRSCEGLPLDTGTPPPRPPSYNSGQSRDRYSSSSQSGQSNASSPLEDTLPGVRFAERSLSDVDEAPPAIPPRASTRNKTHQRSDSASQDFMESMRQLKDCGWYWGPLSWEEAEQKLSSKPEGTFLVRDSSDERYILSLSFKNQGRVHHTRIEHNKGNFSFWSQPDSHGKSTIKEFIEQCVFNSENGRFLYFIRPSGPGSPPMPIHLLIPVSRFVQMQSLQHMCRFRIVQMVRRDHIEDLPVPTRVKQYLKEAQYYVEYLDD